MISSCPSEIKSVLRPFASMMERIETRCCSAIVLKVSPGRTRYLTNAAVGFGAVGVAVDVARGGVTAEVGRGVEEGTATVGRSGRAGTAGLEGMRVIAGITEGTGGGDPIRRKKKTPRMTRTRATPPRMIHAIFGNPSPSPR